ncbi:class I SAM-dependent methyltransferase [Actinomadura sp. KC216]|uniref:class I SAM-dependent DNA methyltransferase n=1 Tax=Actinomadura sp. KC216 TaxID=2530370 RepID=UPI00105001CE|nr:class I SAM-dependent methyltransferase [Actinomadura sp. KC216]TDB85809.1 class I SAM-dependent methyltransferase [Actinomadura sp. KC216]
MTEEDRFGPADYGDRLADVYDDWVVRLQDEGDAELAAKFLGELARRGRGEGEPLLELGIGSGRVALPLAANGLQVTGIEASQKMIDLLKARPGGDRITVVAGDMADVDVPGTYEVVFVVFNTFLLLPSQEEQLRCFTNVAKRLRPGGAFVVQAFIPNPGLYDFGATTGERMEVARRDEGVLYLGMRQHDKVAQLMWPRYTLESGDGERTYDVKYRYVWPSEFDLMALNAGLVIESRSADWSGAEFTAESESHVTVYRKPAE